MQIHAVWKITARREQALTTPAPILVSAGIPPAWGPLLTNDMWAIWKAEWAAKGWQPWMVRRMLEYYTLWATTRLGYTLTPARLFARMAVKAFIANAITYTTVPVAAIFGAAFAALVILACVWSLWPKEGYWEFSDGECLMQYQNRIWFGHVIAHPFENTWDVKLCGLAGEGVWVQRRKAVPGYPTVDIWQFDQLLEWWAAKLIGYWVWALRWGYTSYLRQGKEVMPGVYRVWPKQDFRGMWLWPVGWVRSVPTTCTWWLTLKDNFIVM